MATEGDTMNDDEATIRTNYRFNHPWDPIWMAAPLAAAPILDVKWVLAIAASVITFHLIKLEKRLHDLSIRHRRTNLLMSNRGEAG
jgi:hypothetical protein